MPQVWLVRIPPSFGYYLTVAEEHEAVELMPARGCRVEERDNCF